MQTEQAQIQKPFGEERSSISPFEYAYNQAKTPNQSKTKGKDLHSQVVTRS